MNGIENQCNAWLHPPKRRNTSLYTTTSSSIHRWERKGRENKRNRKRWNFYSWSCCTPNNKIMSWFTRFFFPYNFMKNYLLLIHKIIQILFSLHILSLLYPNLFFCVAKFLILVNALFRTAIIIFLIFEIKKNWGFDLFFYFLKKKLPH